MSELLLEYGVVLGIAFILSTLLGRLIIPILQAKKAGQRILEIGPSWHHDKEGTPTMGGISFILAILLTLTGISFWYFFRGKQSELIPLALTMALAVMNGMIGFVDDFCKLVKKQNEGLKAYQKFTLQVLMAVIYILLLNRLGYIETAVHIPFTEITVELGIVYYVFALFVIVGMVNSVNLTDGLDGLAGTVTLIVFLFFSAVGLSYWNSSLSLISAALVGGMLGFLIYNLHPAKMFMGDTGSLFLGGAVTGAAFIINEPMIIFLVGGMYALESLSVILQVGSYKLRHGKRIFLMAPIHHHFEKKGWGEAKIVTVFGVITAALCVLAWFGL
ncbi:MAG: phospho-N-acetylmuramoyl-pentapeptide-transferase [Clostridia bacterium]|nr:phospho-N-acetylmuramoyl-pentapeptide-transferase [Clostridia bacterium]